MTPNATNDLPEWEDIIAAQPGDGSGLDGLNMIIEAMWPDKNGRVVLTKKRLKDRLDCLFPEKAPFTDETVEDLLQRAITHRIIESSFAASIN